MNEQEIFITGAKGQLGIALQAKYPNARTDPLDISEKDSVENFDWSGIKILINAAAYTNVDGAETPEGRHAAWSVNADAVANLVAVAAQHDMILVHLSTDYVFDGTLDNHKEDEGFAPLSVYGSTKAAGDIIVSLAPKFYIIRTSWVIGEGKNFVRTMMDLAGRGISPTVVNDQIGRLTFTSTLVNAIEHLSTKQCSYGTYNVTNAGKSVSWADITRETFKLLKRDDLKVTDTSTEEYFRGKDGIAPRPLLSSLDLAKIQSTGLEISDWKEDLKTYVERNI